MNLWTAQNYADRRDVFVEALAALQEAATIFVEAVEDFKEVKTANDVAWELDQQGSNLTGDEYLEVQSAIALFEKLVGRAHESSVALEKVEARAA